MSESPNELITAHGLRFEIAGMSEQGPRSENQDAFSIDRFGDTVAVLHSKLAAGEHWGGWGLTEPTSGSDAASLRTMATRDGDGWNVAIRGPRGAKVEGCQGQHSTEEHNGPLDEPEEGIRPSTG